MLIIYMLLCKDYGTKSAMETKISSTYLIKMTIFRYLDACIEEKNKRNKTKETREGSQERSSK